MFHNYRVHAVKNFGGLVPTPLGPGIHGYEPMCITKLFQTCHQKLMFINQATVLWYIAVNQLAIQQAA